jgi:hypothetical protein
MFDPVNRSFDIAPAFAPKEGQLFGARRDQTRCRHPQETDPPSFAGERTEELGDMVVEIRADVGGVREGSGT